MKQDSATKSDLLVPLRLLFGQRPAAGEIAAALSAAIATAAFVWQQGRRTGLETRQRAVLVALAADLGGGIVANLTRSTNTWYRRKVRWLSYVFLAAHAEQPLAAARAVGSNEHRWWLIRYLYALGSGSVVLGFAGSRLQRPLAALLVILGIVADRRSNPIHPALRWFTPLYFIKLIGCFSVDHYGVIDQPARDRTGR